MAYIGAEPAPGQNRAVDDISSSFNGSTTAFTLQVSGVNFSPESANNILVSLGGVMQKPGTDYTIAAATITFTTAPASGLSFWALILGDGIDTATVADQTIGPSKLLNTAVTAGSYTTADITVDAQGRITAAANGTIAQSEIANDAIGADQLASNSVVSASIVDGSIVNADINASAAIAGSKIADDSISLAKLEHGTGSNDGKFLRANNGADPSFETITGTTINNNADNRVITGSGTANTLEGESDLTFDGTNLTIPDKIVHAGDSNTSIRFPANDNISIESAGAEVFRITHDGAHGATQSIQLRVGHTIDGAAVNMGGTKAYSGGIIRGQANIRDGNAYNVTDNGGGIGFSAIYNNGGSHTTMSQIEGVKANNTDGNYEGAIKFATRHHNGNMVEKARIGLNGLSFQGDTADANCLDDFETGTWTPAIGVGSLNFSQGTYTKIGNSCTVQVYVNGFTNNTSSTEISLSGLPFTSASNNGATGACFTGKISINDTITAYIGGSTTTMNFFDHGTGDYDHVRHNNINGTDSTHRLFATVTYRTT